MAFPNKKELDRVRKKLAKVEPTRLLPSDAPSSDKLKFDLCKQFVVYLREHNITQKELSERLGIEAARVNEIVKYKIDLFTADRLMDYLEILNPRLKITIGF